jgi:hypothetical protein
LDENFPVPSSSRERFSWHVGADYMVAAALGNESSGRPAGARAMETASK